LGFWRGAEAETQLLAARRGLQAAGGSRRKALNVVSRHLAALYESRRRGEPADPAR
jgi:hypothetical protein